MKIRMATKRDAEMITTQNIALAKESEDIILNPEIVLAGVKALLSDKNKGFYLVAEENNTIVGQVMITVEWSDWRNKPIWWIQSVYVQKESRKKKVFTQLLDYVRQKSRKQGVAFLRLYAHKDNRSALDVYEKIGWKQEPYVVYHLSS
ncbi:MAG TPA: GNAT family N-acetyltransferase [Candidatus Thermoplasmatota archaeon]|nr:GNAT family N-acetyltransferase [Candidatus Thermoplasmatota archaeon]